MTTLTARVPESLGVRLPIGALIDGVSPATPLVVVKQPKQVTGGHYVVAVVPLMAGGSC